MESRSKAEAYIGFAIKAGKVKCGAQLIRMSKNAKLIIVCHTAKKNSIKQAESLARRFNVKLIISLKKTVSELCGKENTKIIGVYDTSLAQAIINSKDENFSELKVEA